MQFKKRQSGKDAIASASCHNIAT